MGAERGRRGGQHGPPYGPNPAKNASRELVRGLCASGIAMPCRATYRKPSYPRKAGIQYAAAFRFNHRRLWKYWFTRLKPGDDGQ